MRPKNLEVSLTKFFRDVCVDYTDGEQNSVRSYLVKLKSRGCVYTYFYHTVNHQLYSPITFEPYTVYSIPHSTDIYHLEFHSYEKGVLKIRYQVHPSGLDKWEIQEKGEAGIMMMNLSLFSEIGDPILVQFVPHLPFEGYLIKEIPEPSYEDRMTVKKLTGWGALLSVGALSLKSADPNLSSGMTVARNHPFWIKTSSKSSYLHLKEYIESGSMYFFGILDFFLYSAAVLTASPSGGIEPNTAFMKLLVSIESILGIAWLGFLVGWGYDQARNFWINR